MPVPYHVPLAPLDTKVVRVHQVVGLIVGDDADFLALLLIVPGDPTQRRRLLRAK